jgi:hypothetical protein
MNDNERWNLIVDVGEILLNRVKELKEPLITYGDLARLLPYEINPRNLDDPLGNLSDQCKELGLPLISTMVVNKDTMQPGAGYFNYFFPGTKELRRIEIFIEQYDRVKKCRDWTALAEWLSLE